jgi:hypothetical protein
MLYFIIGLLAYGAFYNDPVAFGIITTMMFLFATVFYYMCFHLVSGLTKSSLDMEMPLSDTFLMKVAYITTAVAVFKTENDLMIYAMIFSLPWVLVNIMTDIFTFLVKKEILIIMPVDKE